MKKLTLLFNTSRPISWVNTAYPFAAGYIMTGGSVDARFLIGTLFFLIPYNLLMYGVNDVYDYESDIRNPRKGGVEGAITPKKFHPFILLSAFVSCLPFVAALAFLSTPLAALTLAILLFFVVAYSAKGLRFKEVPVLDSITSSLHFTGPLVFALSLHAFPVEAWPYVIAFFLWGLASHAFGAVQDIIPDREAGIGSIATVLGARGTVWFSFSCYVVASLLVAVQSNLGAIVGVSGLAYILNVSPFLKLSDGHSEQARAGWKRFLWINYFVGFVVTICLIIQALWG